MDYKEFYECEMKRADKAEDELAAAQARIAKLEGKLAEAKRHIIDSLWHPVLEPPSDNGYVDVVVRGYYNEDVERWMIGPDFRTVSDDVILEWRYPRRAIREWVKYDK